LKDRHPSHPLDQALVLPERVDYLSWINFGLRHIIDNHTRSRPYWKSCQVSVSESWSKAVTAFGMHAITAVLAPPERDLSSHQLISSM
jgi:hypothetical protein